MAVARIFGHYNKFLVRYKGQKVSLSRFAFSIVLSMSVTLANGANVILHLYHFLLYLHTRMFIIKFKKKIKIKPLLFPGTHALRYSPFHSDSGRGHVTCFDQ